METEIEGIKQAFIIEIPIYQCKIQVYLCTDVIEVCKELKLNEEVTTAFDNADLSGLTIADHSNTSNYVILFQDDLRLDTIVHEVHHVVGFILLARNTPYTHETMESYAYFTEYLFKTIRNTLRAFIKE